MNAPVPIRPAATILLVDDRPNLQVLVLERRKASDFVGGMSVFPGGGIDEEDGAPEAAALVDGIDEDRARRRLGVESGGLAHWVAAVRETFEESGVLLARRPGEVRPIELLESAVCERFAAHRDAVDGGRALLADVLAEEGLRLATDHIHYVSRWITPPGPTRRYDTRFFLARTPAGQEASADLTEAVHAEWVQPAAALERFVAGELRMLPPTATMLRILSGFGSADEALAAARSAEDGEDHGARVCGRVGGLRELWEVQLPGDVDYETGDDDGSLAWVRWLSPAAARSAIRGPGGAR